MRKIHIFCGKQAESVIGVSNSLEAFREFAELMLKVYLRVESKIAGFPKENLVFGYEQAESAIGVSNSLEAFREFAELILKVYLSMETKIDDLP